MLIPRRVKKVKGLPENQNLVFSAAELAFRPKKQKSGTGERQVRAATQLRSPQRGPARIDPSLVMP